MPFKKGQSGNPKGAPVKEMRVSTWIEKELDKVVPESVDPKLYKAGVTIRQSIAQRLVLQALTHPENDLPYIKEVMDRTEGKPKQQTDITSNGETLPVLVQFIGDESPADN